MIERLPRTVSSKVSSEASPEPLRGGALGAVSSALIGLAFVSLAALNGTAGESAASPPAGGSIRFCAAHEAPYSIADGSGFENRIAETVARAMGRTAVFIWSNAPATHAVRDELKAGTCDVVVGVDTDDSRVLTTRPYYRAPYVFIRRRDSKLDITSWQSRDLLAARNIGFVLGTPGQIMLEKLGLFRMHFDYVYSRASLTDRRYANYVRSTPDQLVSDVGARTADVAVAFAPEVARYVKANPDLVMTVIPDDNVLANGVKVPHQFDQSMGVRKEDVELAAALDAAIAKARSEIERILADEGIPLVGS